MISFALVFIFLTLPIAQAAFVHVKAADHRSPNSLRMTTTAGDETTKDANETYKVQTWNPLRLAVLRLGMTEPAWTSPHNYGKEEGAFSCAFCGKVLFDSTMKYDSGSGWPSFWRTIDEGSVKYRREFKFGANFYECLCGRCKSHLGHAFLDGPRKGDVAQDLVATIPPSDRSTTRDPWQLPRYCMNGAALRFQPRNASKQDSYLQCDL